MKKIDQEIKGNGNVQAGRDVISVHPAQPSLAKVIEKLKEEAIKDPDFEGYIDELASYMTDIESRRVIGLEEKLKKANREDLIVTAMELKELFAKKLAKEQLSLFLQKVYVQILAVIRNKFNGIIKPLIAEGKEISVIDGEIYYKIVEEIHNHVAPHVTELTMDHIAGMLYYLTGKCHVEWT